MRQTSKTFRMAGMAPMRALTTTLKKNKTEEKHNRCMGFTKLWISGWAWCVGLDLLELCLYFLLPTPPTLHPMTSPAFSSIDNGSFLLSLRITWEMSFYDSVTDLWDTCPRIERKPEPILATTEWMLYLKFFSISQILSSGLDGKEPRKSSAI